MRPRLRLAGGALVGVTLALLAGCSTKKLLQPNIPPQTSIFVQFDDANGTPHSVNHRVHLYWFGSDVDGYVVGYEFRFLFAGGPADPAWSFTTQSDSLFTIPDTTGLTTPTFQVRAIDNSGARDATPATQKFDFTNLAPTVMFVDVPTMADTTFATQTIAWQGIDPDGDANLLSYRVWLDGHDANPHTTAATTFTFPTADFRQGPTNVLRSGPRSAFVQAIDSGGRASTPVSCTWFVRSPVPDTLQRARLLLIDDVPQLAAGNAGIDNFYNAAVTRSLIPLGSFTVLRLATGRPFRSSKDLEQSLDLFEAVVWYRGLQTYDATRDTLLVRHSAGVGAYLDQGGRMLLECRSMIDGPSSPGLLSQAFMQQYLGSDFLFLNKTVLTPDSTCEWSIAQAYQDSVNGVPVSHPAILHSSVFADTLKMNQNLNSLRVFGVRDSNQVALWAPESTLTLRQPFKAALGVAVPLASGGKIVAVTLPIAAGNGFGVLPGAPQGTAARFIDKVFAYLGVQGP